MLAAIVLTLVGCAFVVAEVFFPSLGLLGLVAGTLFITADVAAFGESQAAGWAFVVLQVVLVPFLVRQAFRLLPRLPFGRRMLLEGPARPSAAGIPDLAALVGRRGTALTDLRPAGIASLGGERVSVVSVGGFVRKGEAVEAESVDGAEVRVRALPPHAGPQIP
jgi:membrane-bound serine protease (ClpP class)